MIESIHTFSNEISRKNNLPVFGFGAEIYDNTVHISSASDIAILSAIDKITHDPSISAGAKINRPKQKQPWVEFDDKTYYSMVEKNIFGIPVSLSHDKQVAIAIAAIDDLSFDNLRVGVDITHASRFEKLISKNDIFPFTKSEQKEINGNKYEIAKRWAIKESFVKVLGTGFSNGVGRSHIETRWEDDRYKLKLYSKAFEFQQHLELKNVMVNTFISDDFVVAYCIAYS